MYRELLCIAPPCCCCCCLNFKFNASCSLNPHQARNVQVCNSVLRFTSTIIMQCCNATTSGVATQQYPQKSRECTPATREPSNAIGCRYGPVAFHIDGFMYIAFQKSTQRSPFLAGPCLHCLLDSLRLRSRFSLDILFPVFPFLFFL